MSANVTPLVLHREIAGDSRSQRGMKKTTSPTWRSAVELLTEAVTATPGTGGVPDMAGLERCTVSLRDTWPRVAPKLLPDALLLRSDLDFGLVEGWEYLLARDVKMTSRDLEETFNSIRYYCDTEKGQNKENAKRIKPFVL